jgi:hypothetical protein
MITGLEISKDVYLLKKARTKNLIYYDRYAKLFAENAFTNLNEYTTEFVLVPGYDYNERPFVLARTNTSLKLINVRTRIAYFLLDLGFYESHLHGALHAFYESRPSLNKESNLSADLGILR